MANTIQISADTSGFVRGIERANNAMQGLGKNIQSATAPGMFSGVSQIKNAFNGITNALAGGDIKGAVTAMGSALASIPGPLVAVAAGAAIVGVAAKGMWAAMDKSKQMSIMAEQSGMTATQFFALSKVFGRVGIDAEQLPGVMSKMAASMAEIADPSSKAAQALAKMGIGVEDMAGKGQYEQFKRIAQGIESVKNATERVTIARTIFGRSGAQLLPGMKIADINKIEKKGSPVAQIAEDMGGAFTKFQGTVKGLSVNFGDFFLGMAATAIPALQTVVDKLSKIDLTSIGKVFGDAIAFWVNYFSNFGATGDLIYNTMKLAFMGAINFLDEEIRVLLAQTAVSVKNIFKGESTQKKAISEAEIQAKAAGPLFDTSSTEAALQAAMDKINASKEKQIAAAKELKPLDVGGLELTAKTASSIPQLITSSFAKVGATGGPTWGMEQGLSVQREQLTVQTRIANSIDAFLKAATPTSNPYIGSVTPQLGII